MLAITALVLLPMHATHAKRFTHDDIPTVNRIVILYSQERPVDDSGRLSRIGWEAVNEGEDIDEKIAAIKEREGTITAAPNFTRAVSEIEPNDIDTDPDTQYHERTNANGNIKATKAWTVHKGKGVVIAVIDTGVDTDHEDLKNKIWSNGDEVAGNGKDDDHNGFIDDDHGWDFFNENNKPEPNLCGSSNDTAVSHGSHVAGLAAATTDNDKGVAGIGWETKIMPLQVSNCDGLMDDADIAEAIQYATANGADIINMSLGGIGRSSVLEEVISEAQEQGVIVVAAAGNESINIDRVPYSPACIDGVITVAATDSNDRAAGFSNFGSDCVDIAAPGVDLLSSVYNDGSEQFSKKYDVYSGTSMATPVVSGALALARGQQKSLKPSEARKYLKDSADDVGISSAYGAGRLNAVKLLLALDSVKSVHIKAYNNSNKDKKFSRGSRQKDQTPYFSWVVPSLLKSEISEYCIYFGTNEDADPFTQGKCKNEAKKSIPSLDEANGKTYYLRVGVIKTDGSHFSKTGTFKYILDTKVKPAPELKTLEAVDGGVKISWKKSDDKHVNKYQVLRKLKSEDNFDTIGTVDGDSAAFTDTSVIGGKTFVYKVKALDTELNLSKASGTKSIAL